MKKRKLLYMGILALTLIFSFGCSNLDVSENKVIENPKDNKEEKKEKNVFYVNALELNVRENPSKSSPILGKLKKFNEVIVLEEHMEKNEGEAENKWFKVEFVTKEKGKQVGWISSSYTAKTREEILSDKVKGLNLSPQKKTDEYPDNKRVSVKGVYVTVHSARGEGLERLIRLAKNTEINAFVIDVKDDNGQMLFESKGAEKFAPLANTNALSREAAKNLVERLKKENIYLIARIVTFKDPIYTQRYPERAIIDTRNNATFMSSDGLRWASPHDRKLWEYDAAIAKEAADLGFNEIQFDYVRFPESNGGKLDQVLDYRNDQGDLSKAQTIQNFLKYAKKELSSSKVYISADIFGLVASVTDDMSIGQYWEGVSNIVDYICPMMYPSHYGNNIYGLPIPDAYPYETVFYSTKDSIERNKNIHTPAAIRPWIQDFTASWVKGNISYDVEEVNAQIKALKDNGVKEYLLWNATNKYSFE